MSVEQKNTRGVFVAVEGMDGSGKSTVVKRLTEILTARQNTVVQTHEVGGTPIGKKLRDICFTTTDEKLDPRARLLMVLASRLQHINEVIRPALKAGSIVVTDRYELSTLVYNVDLDNQSRLYSELPLDALGVDIKPDLYILLDVDHEVAFKRGRARPDVDNDTYKQNLDQARQIKDAYWRRALQAKHEGVFVRAIKTDGSPEEVEQELLRVASAVEHLSQPDKCHGGIASGYLNIWSAGESGPRSGLETNNG